MRRLGKELVHQLGLLLHAAHPLLNLRVETAFVLGTGTGGIGRRRRAHWTPRNLNQVCKLLTIVNEFGDSSRLRVSRLDTTSLQTGRPKAKGRSANYGFR